MEFALNEINDLISDINLKYTEALYLIDHVEQIELLPTAFSNDTDFILHCKQLKIIETANIVSGIEQFDYSSKDSIIAGLEFNISSGMEKIKQIFKWLWAKIKELFTKLKTFIITTFKKITNTDKYEQIKEQTFILDQLHQSNTKETLPIIKPIYDQILGLLNTEIETIPLPILTQSIDITFNVLQQIFNESLTVPEEEILIWEQTWKFGAKYEAAKYTEEPKVKELVLNLLKNESIKFDKMSFMKFLNLDKYTKTETFELNKAYIKFYENARYVSTNLENIMSELETRLKNIENWFFNDDRRSVILVPRHIEDGHQKHILFIQKLVTPIVALINRCIITQTLAIHKVITEFEKNIDEYTTKQFSKEYSVYANPDPIILQKVYTFKGFDCYSAINYADPRISNLEHLNTHVSISMFNPRMFIYLDRRMTELTDYEIKDWVIAHEVGHMINNHPFMMRMLTITSKFKYFRNKDIDKAKADLETLRIKSKENEYVADEYAYKLYGLDISIKALTWYVAALGIKHNKSTNTHASLDDRINRLRQLEQNKK